MAIITDPEREQREREEYLEDLAFEENRDREEREHEIRTLKIKLAAETRYKTIEKVARTLFKLIPYCFVIVALTVLTLAKRDIPSSLEKFLAS